MKKSLFSLLGIVGTAFGLVLYALSFLKPEQYSYFTLAYMVALISGVWGISFLLKGAFYRKDVVMQKTRFLVGIIFVAIAIAALVWGIIIPADLVLPIILIVIAAVIVFIYLFKSRRRWDEGDNHDKGYKNYYERKAEEEKLEAKQKNKK